MILISETITCNERISHDQTNHHTLPRANSAASNNKLTPMDKNKTPNPVTINPISTIIQYTNKPIITINQYLFVLR